MINHRQIYILRAKARKSIKDFYIWWIWNDEKKHNGCRSACVRHIFNSCFCAVFLQCKSCTVVQICWYYIFGTVIHFYRCNFFCYHAKEPKNISRVMDDRACQLYVRLYYMRFGFYSIDIADGGKIKWMERDISFNIGFFDKTMSNLDLPIALWEKTLSQRAFCF